MAKTSIAHVADLLPFARQLKLFTPLLESRISVGVDLMDTPGTGHAFAIKRRCNVFAGQGPTTRVALNVTTFRKIAIDRDAGIENEAFALPEAVVRIDGLKVIQDSAPQLVHLVESQLLH